MTYKKKNGKYYIESDKVPLHKFYTLAITPQNIPVQKLDKAVIAVEYQYGKKRVKDYFDTEYKDGKLVADVRDFGVFSIEVDEQPPKITPINVKYKSKFSPKYDRMKFKVKDTQSGVKTHDVYIDGQWVVSVYDLKNDLIYIDLNKENVSKGEHEFTIKVKDNSNNLSTFTTTIFYN